MSPKWMRKTFCVKWFMELQSQHSESLWKVCQILSQTLFGWLAEMDFIRVTTNL